MQFYQLEYTPKVFDKVLGEEFALTPKREWFGSERAAVVRRLELFKAGQLHGKKKDHSIWPIDVPTRKEDMLAWLNQNAV